METVISMEFALALILYGIVGMAGGITYVMLHKSQCYTKWDRFKMALIRRSWLGFVAGGIYHYLMTMYGLPNGLACFFVGFTAETFLTELINNKKLRGGENGKEK